MIANPHRGEVCLRINGKARQMRLSLGALAALEHQLGAKSFAELITRVAENTLTTRDIIWVLQAGLYGGGTDDVDIGAAQIEGGAKAAAFAAVALLARSFDGAEI